MINELNQRAATAAPASQHMLRLQATVLTNLFGIVTGRALNIRDNVDHEPDSALWRAWCNPLAAAHKLGLALSRMAVGGKLKKKTSEKKRLGCKAAVISTFGVTGDDWRNATPVLPLDLKQRFDTHVSCVLLHGAALLLDRVKA